MELNHLKYFYSVAKAGGFSSAARNLRIAQPAISKTVKKLESDLGLDLFERRGRGVALTKAGNDLYRKCEVIFNHVEEINADLRRKSPAISGPLNFGAVEVIASHLIAPSLGQVVKEHPRLQPHLVAGTASELVEHISRRRLEFGFFFHVPALPAQLEIIRTIGFRFILVVASKWANDPSVCNSFIGSREVDDIANQKYPTLARHRQQFPNAEIKISTNSLSAHRQMVLQGLGVSILPDFLVGADIKSGKLKNLLPNDEFNFNLKIVARRGEPQSAAAKVFIDCFFASLR